MTKQRKINSTYAIVMVIGLAFMLLFGYLVKPFSTVTVTGVKMLGVLIGLIIITCFNGDLLSGSLMALLATLFHGYYDISGLLSEWLGSVFTVQLVFCGALCLALRDSGAMNVLAKKLLSSKLCRGRPVMTMVMLFLATYVAAAFIGGPPVYILFFGLVESIRDVCGYDKDDPFVKWTLLGVYIAATGIFFFAFKTPQVMTIALINSAMEPFGRTFNEGTWMLCMFSITMIYLIVYTILMKTVYRVNMEPLKSLDFNEIEAMRNTPDHFNRDQIIGLAMIIIPVIYILIGTVYPKEAPGRYFFTFMGNSWIWVLKVNIKKVQDILARDQDVPLPRNPYTDPSYMQNVVDHEYGLYTQLAKNAREKAGYLSGVRQFGANQGEIVDSDSKSIKGGGDAQLNPNLIKATPQH